jgi:hypothetical protein
MQTHCNCLSEIELKTANQLLACLDQDEQKTFTGQLENKKTVIVGDHFEAVLTIPFKASFKRKDDSGHWVTRPQTQVVTLNANYCPFCGEKLELIA